ncbi:MAG: hypothetical protein WD794_01010 [Mycobacteriales bacterium]
MTLHPAVPSDVEADSIVDLVHDCREINDVLGSSVPTEIRLPDGRAMPVEISLDAVATLSGYDDYGS